MRWFEEHRQEWIGEMLRIYGFINREHLSKKFGVSTPQASKDLNRYLRKNPEKVYYDLSAKKYVRIEG